MRMPMQARSALHLATISLYPHIHPCYAKRVKRKKTIVVIGVIALLAAATVIAAILMNNRTAAPAVATIQAPISGPQYSTILPTGKTIDRLGGWKRVSPPDQDPVYSYEDSISSVAISVSEQKLPVSFTSNADSQVADLAKKFSATNQIDAGGTKVYVGTSVDGPQSVIAVKKNVLLLIKSVKKVDDKAWSAYVTALN